MLEKIPLNRESHVYSCISENSAVNEGIVKSGHRIELLIISNVYLWKKKWPQNSFVTLLVGSFNCLICGQSIDTASTKINRNLRRAEVIEEQEKEKETCSLCSWFYFLMVSYSLLMPSTHTPSGAVGREHNRWMTGSTHAVSLAPRHSTFIC